MRLPSGKRLGQSGYELALAVFFTFFIHAAVVATALFLSNMAIPKKVVPPVYRVKLVALPQEPAPPLPTAPVEPAPASPPPEAMKKPAPPSQKAGKSAVKPIPAKAALNPNAAPELSSQKAKPPAPQPPIAETTDAQPATKTSTEKSASSGGGVENIVVNTPEQEFNAKFPYYFASITNKIKKYWNPPPDAKDAKVRVSFTVSRLGRVGDVAIDSEHTSGTFGFQQAAIRALRESKQFPPLPEEFSKRSLQFTVDLMAE